jgi:hypothetical protein
MLPFVDFTLPLNLSELYRSPTFLQAETSVLLYGSRRVGKYQSTIAMIAKKQGMIIRMLGSRQRMSRLRYPREPGNIRK